MKKIKYNAEDKLTNDYTVKSLNNKKIAYYDIRSSHKKNKEPIENLMLDRTHNLQNDNNTHLNRSQINFYQPKEIQVGYE